MLTSVTSLEIKLAWTFMWISAVYPLSTPPFPHFTHYSIASVKRVIAQITQRQLSACDTRDHKYHHKQPLMALSGSSNTALQLGPSSAQGCGAKRCGHRGAAAGAKFYPNEFGPCQVTVRKAVVAVQYPPRWSEATPVATVHASEHRAMWKRGGGIAVVVFVFGSGIHSYTYTWIGVPDCKIAHSPTRSCSQTKGDKLIFMWKSSRAQSCWKQWLKYQITGVSFCWSCFWAFKWL